MKRHFQINDDSRTLILEDDTWERIEWFRARLPRATMVRNPQMALLAFLAGDWDYVFLDHDVPCPVGGDGLLVARFLAKQNFSGRVIVHSANAPRALLMGQILWRAGIVTAVSEFGDFSIEVIG